MTPASCPLLLLSATLLVLLAAPVSSARSAAEWEFHGIEVLEDAGCVNNPSVSARHVWLPRGAGFEPLRLALREDLREAHGSLFNVETVRVRPGRPKVIALVKKVVRCTRYSGPTTTVETYRWHAAATQEDLARELESNQRTSVGILSYEVARYVDVEAELQALTEAAPYRETVEESYGPLQVTYTSSSARQGRTVVHVRATNTDRSKAAVIEFTADGRPGDPVVIQPGQTFNGPVEAAGAVGVRVLMWEPREATPDRAGGLFEAAKDVIRSLLQVEEGKVRDTSWSCNCVRG